jgi:hypothetical protein
LKEHPRDIQSLEIFNDSPAPMYNVYVDEQYYQQNTNSKLKAPHTNRPITYLRKSRALVGPSIVNPHERATFNTQERPKFQILGAVPQPLVRVTLENAPQELDEYYFKAGRPQSGAIVTWQLNSTKYVAYLRVPRVSK